MICLLIEIEDELIAMFNGMTAIDQKWIIRIILKKVKLGLGQQKILQLYHPRAKDFYDQYSHLSRVCKCIESGEQLRPAGSVEPLQPVRPMLCEKLDIFNLANLLAKKEYYLETKMDGERFQIHMANEMFKYFSRNSFEYTSIFGGKVTEGTLTPHLVRAFKMPIESFILDGEMMVWNREEQCFHTKGENFDVKSLKKNDNTLRPCYCAYDILYLNGTCMTDKPYAERIRLLGRLLSESIGIIIYCKPIKIRDR